MDEESTAMSYGEWNAAGYHIIKGQKSQSRDALGVPQFTRAQVSKNTPKRVFTTYRSSFSESHSRRSLQNGGQWGVIRNFDDFVRENTLLPDGRGGPTFAITNPMERHFMEVADKHGILDAIIDGDADDWY